MPLTHPPPQLELEAAVLEHAYRGVRLQLLLRAALVVFVALTVGLVPPVQGASACYAIVAAYAVWAASFAAWAWRDRARAAARAWLGLFVDLLVLAALTLLAGVSAEQSWTADVLANGFFLLPALAATQLRPGVCAAVVVPTVLVYLGSSVATQSANDEPWASIALPVLVLAGLGIGCVGLSQIQRSRVRAISGLARERTALLDDLVHVQEREQRELSERLHDGALQYLLAARHDIDDLRDETGPEALARIERAFTESSRLLRSTVSELHPAVLERAGLARALEELAEAHARPGRSIELDLEGWPGGARTSADGLLLGAARELLANAVKHAEATTVRVIVSLDDGTARLTVGDDGRGIPREALEHSLDRGHIGLHSQTLRIQAAGGSLTFTPAQPSGTIATVELPVML